MKQNNKEKKREINRRSYRNCRTKRLAYQKKYYQEHAEELIERRREYQKNYYIKNVKKI